jgi:hypothetical protein
MADKPQSRVYNTGDELQIVKVLDKAFEGWPSINLSQSKTDYWKWKYQNNYTKKLVGVAEIDNKIVGCHHTVPMKVKVFDQIHLFGTGGDVAVLKEYRRRGVRKSFSPLVENLRKEAGLSIIIMLTGNPIVIDYYKRRGDRFKLPIELVHYVRIRDIDLHLEKNPMENAWVQKFGYQTLDAIRSLKQFIAVKKNIVSNIKVSFVKEFDERVDVFWDKVSQGYDLKTVTNKKYLNWRYCDPRGGAFRILVAEVDREVVGYLVLLINSIREEYYVGSIVDMLSYDDRSDVIEALLEKAMSYFDDNSVNIINYLAVKGYKFDSCLMKYGFLDSKRNHAIYYSLPREIDYLKKVASSSSNKIHFGYGELI